MKCACVGVHSSFSGKKSKRQAGTGSVLFGSYKMTAITISPASHGIIQVINESNLCKIERYMLYQRLCIHFFLVRSFYMTVIDFFVASSMTRRTGNPSKMPRIIIADCAGNDGFVCLSSIRRQVLFTTIFLQNLHTCLIIMMLYNTTVVDRRGTLLKYN